MFIYFQTDRQQQIQNEFDLVDLHSKGRLSQQQIIAYLTDKYEWVNTEVIKQLFRSMEWGNDSCVTKQEFTKKYIARERALYNQIYGLTFYEKWAKVLGQIYDTETNVTNPVKPKVYFYTQIRKIALYVGNQQIECVDIVVEYQNHYSKNSYQIQQVLHETNYPSFEIWLPASGDSFFLRLKFYDCNNRQILLGQTYFNIPLQDKINKMVSLELPITKNGNNVGHCQVYVYTQTSMVKVKEQLNEIWSKQRTYHNVTDDKIKEYQYLQFLWGVRIKSPHKVQQIQAKWMLACRMVLLILIGVLGGVVYTLGRCEPLSIIIMFLMLRSWEFVLLRTQKFLLTVLTVLAIFIDIAWLALGSIIENQINFQSLQYATFCTYFLFGIKVVLLGYLIIIQKSVSNS